jgi:NADH-quinone oxidoreductase subunit J
VAQLLFYLLSAAAIAFGVGVVAAKSPMQSVLSLLGAFVALGVVYLLAGFQFLAAAQLIVYAGAILVLFLFVVMLLNMSDLAALVEHPTRVLGHRRVAIAVLSAGVLGVVAILAAGSVSAAGPAAAVLPEGYDSLEHVASLLFSRYMVPFQAAGVLLLATMIGVLVLAKRRRATRQAPAAAERGDAHAAEAGR